MLIEIEPEFVQTRPVPVWVWGWLEVSSFLQMVPRLDASNLEQMDLSTAGGCKVWAGSGSRLLVLIELQPSRHPDKTGARFGFGSGR